MTDELERLLSEEQEEPEQVAEVLKLRAAEYSAARKGKGAAVEAGGEQVAVSGEIGTAPGFGEVGRAEPEEELSREESARRLYRSLSQTRRAVRTARQPRENSRTPLVRQSGPAVDSGREALWLDRIFQRDARRYDGGFTWQ